ncbi:MAG TPA: hypothetical protein VMV69_20780 [Pirellulales bacterium]|nr:hypothetical protein [Pirellulales bacterium]
MRSAVTLTRGASKVGGAFENQLTSITVQADAQGMAEAKFLATAGTIANIHILAASPLASGQARFIVNVAPPEGAAASAGNAVSGTRR